VEKEQISMMHRIYQSAAITIIAQSGTHADAGLPGVSETPRAEIARVEVAKNIEVVMTPLSALAEVPSSKWASRGWTLQEDMLSSVTLSFTEHQFQYRCYQMRCIESEGPWVRTLLDLEANLPEGQSFSLHVYDTKAGFKSTAYDRSYISFQMMVEDFTKRDITYEADSIRALDGMLYWFAGFDGGGYYPVFHIWGLPIPPFNDTAKIDALFWKTLCWAHHTGNTTQRICRRASFPSWSWAGWQGGISFDMTLAFDDFEPYARVALEYNDGKVRGLAQRYENEYDTPGTAVITRAWPVALHIMGALVVSPSLIHDIRNLPEVEGEGYAGMRLICKIGRYFTGELHLSLPTTYNGGTIKDIQHGFQSGRFQVMALALELHTWESLCIVVEQRLGGQYERVGRLKLKFEYSALPTRRRWNGRQRSPPPFTKRMRLICKLFGNERCDARIT
jgi:hypothetical protein